MANHLARMVFQLNFTKSFGMISILYLDVVRSINYSFEKCQTSAFQKRGIITLVLEKDKPTNPLGNLRPISLLKTDYKIAMKEIFIAK